MYYPKFKSFQILISLLKAHDIRHIVISPGSRMREFVLCVEEDPYFVCYSVTDERSAAYFAIGISQELNVPVAISCTSSTATTNYVPGVTEAYYQGVPILVLTGDRDPYLLGQQEDQMIDQVNMYDRVVKKSVHLPIINNTNDCWYCKRLINEAILELNHRGKGPVHINIPVPAMITWEKDDTINFLPEVCAVDRVYLHDSTRLKEKKEELKLAQKILVLAGQNTAPFDSNLLSDFFLRYNCIIHAEHMGNINIQEKMNIAILGEGIVEQNCDDYMPDIVISFNGTLGISRNLKETLRRKKLKHWHVSENGDFVDAYKNLDTIFECRVEHFFEFFNDTDTEQRNNKLYYNIWLKKIQSISLPQVSYSNVWVIRQFLKKIPQNCILHLSILNSIRISHFYELPINTKVYANIGTDGIDGSMSTFLGQACASDKLSFLLIGDLSFFYDMNSLRIKHLKNNVRILLINNNGGNEFYLQKIMPTTDMGLGAKHNNSAQGWTESMEIKYLRALNEEEFSAGLLEFVNDRSEVPILFEVFTDTMDDRKAVHATVASMRSLFDKTAILKDKARSLLGESNFNKIKSIVKKS